MNTPSNLYRLSVVQALELGKDLLISLDKVGQLVKQPGALEARDVFPPGFAEGLPCRRNGNVDVFLRGYKRGVVFKKLGRLRGIRDHQL